MNVSEMMRREAFQFPVATAHRAEMLRPADKNN